MHFIIHQTFRIVFPRKSFIIPLFMLPYSPRQIAGHPRIQSPFILVCKNIHHRMFFNHPAILTSAAFFRSRKMPGFAAVNCCEKSANFTKSSPLSFTNHAIYYTVNAKYYTIISNCGHFEGGVQGRGCPLQVRNAIISVVDCINSVVIAKYSVVKRSTNVKTSANNTANQRFVHFNTANVAVFVLFFGGSILFLSLSVFLLSAGGFFVFSGGMCYTFACYLSQRKIL